jgi:hypothetical protein
MPRMLAQEAVENARAMDKPTQKAERERIRKTS